MEFRAHLLHKIMPQSLRSGMHHPLVRPIDALLIAVCPAEAGIPPLQQRLFGTIWLQRLNLHFARQLGQIHAGVASKVAGQSVDEVTQQFRP